MLAVNALAGRGERQAVPRLRELAADGRPFLAAVAFRPVVAIESPEARQLLLAVRAGPARLDVSGGSSSTRPTG